MNIDTHYFKAKLEAEKKEIEASIQNIAVRGSPDGSWENAEVEKDDSTPSDRMETAESITEYEMNANVVSVLDQKLLDISGALSRLEQGSYGICEVCGKEIEIERLEANPSARTCKSHLNS